LILSSIRGGSTCLPVCSQYAWGYPEFPRE